MAPFGTSFGGPLDDEEVDALVNFIRTWEQNPPVELPPEVAGASESLPASEVYTSLCAQCHGEAGEGGIGPALQDPAFLTRNTDQQIFNSINLGHEATPMIAWGEILTSDQIRGLVSHIRSLEQEETGTPSEGISFASDIVPILEAKCAVCHGTLGGWDASSYDSVLNSGDNAPAVNPGDANGSLLAQKILGTQTEGTIMPPAGKMSDQEIQLILDWIEVGAPDG
jgi:mono/diheme cytochrome c family protein